MKILHLFSNWKWTGPAEHALQLAVIQSQRGHRVVFACAKSPPHAIDDSLESAVLGKGLVPMCRLRLNKHFNVFDNLRDLWTLARYLRTERFDLVHTHLQNDHFLGGLASTGLASRPGMIRTLYDGTMKGGMKNRLLFKRWTDGLVTVSEGAKKGAVEGFKVPPSRVAVIHTPVDCVRFDPSRNLPSERARWRITDHDVVVGIVARIQYHRRFEVLLEAFSLALGEVPNLKALVIGRGTHRAQIVEEPAKRKGLKERIIATGYLREDTYVATLKSIDMKVFLVPGTDGSCRAVKEAMALGKPVIAAARGMLAEIVEDGKSGFVIEDSPANLAHAIVTLARDHALRKRMGEEASRRAREHFDVNTQVTKVEDFYHRILGARQSCV